jgi:hypothetical protein
VCDFRLEITCCRDTRALFTEHDFALPRHLLQSGKSTSGQHGRHCCPRSSDMSPTRMRHSSKGWRKQI